MKLKYGTTVFEIHPAFAPTITFKTKEGLNEAATIEEVWDIEGSFKRDGWQLLMQDWNDMVEKLRVPAQDFAILDESNNTVYELKAADCNKGPTCTITNVTEKRKAYLVTNIRFRLSITAEYDNPDAPADIRGKVDINFQFDSLGFLTLTERGVAKGSGITSPPSPWLSPSTHAFELDSQFELSQDRTECRYTYRWRERKVSLPPALRNLIGSFDLRVQERNADDFLYNTISVSGECRLKGNKDTQKIWAQSGIFVANPDKSTKLPAKFIPVESIDDMTGTAILEIKEWIENHLIGGGVKILSKSIDANIYDQRVSFQFQLLKDDVEGVASFDYSVSIQEPTVRTSVVGVFASAPVVQYLGYNPCQISEEGSVAFFSNRPPHPKPYWPEYCTSRRVDYPKGTSESEFGLALGPVRFSFTYQRDEFSVSDLWKMVLERIGYMGLPQRIFK